MKDRLRKAWDKIPEDVRPPAAKKSGRTRWFVKMPSDGMFGDIYKGRTFEIELPQGLPNIEIADGSGYVENGMISTFPGSLTHDVESGDTYLDDGHGRFSKSGFEQISPREGVATYSAVMGDMRADVFVDSPPSLQPSGISSTPGKYFAAVVKPTKDSIAKSDRLPVFLAFIGTALTASGLSAVGHYIRNHPNVSDNETIPLPGNGLRSYSLWMRSGEG